VKADDRIRIIPAEKEDAGELAKMSKKAFDSDIEVGAPGPGGPPGYDSSEAQIRFMKFLEYFKILSDDKTVGGIMVGSAGNKHKVLERIFVDPAFHRKGIGTQACELLWECYPGVALWTLGTPEWNVRTKLFYEKLGFIQVGWDLGDPDWRGRWYQRIADTSSTYEMLKVGDLRDGMRNVTVEGEVIEKSEPRQVRSRRGEPLTVSNAAIEDETGRTVLVLWNEQIGWVKEGDRIRVENGYTRSYMKVIQLNVGRMGRLILLI